MKSNAHTETKKIKRGTLREDGRLFFSGYTSRSGKRREYWLTPEEFAARVNRTREIARNSAKRAYADPKRREVIKARSLLHYYRNKARTVQRPVEQNTRTPLKVTDLFKFLVPSALLVLAMAALLYVFFANRSVAGVSAESQQTRLIRI